MPTNRFKLGILQTNHDKSVEVGDAFPDDAHRFRDLFDAQETRFDYTIYMTIGGRLPTSLEEQDAFLITGSPLSVLDHHVFTDGLMDFIRACDSAQKPLMGACFGHQAIALALGGDVARSDKGYNVGVEVTRFETQMPWMSPFKEEVPMYMFHEDAVTRLPDGCTHLGSTPNCMHASFAKGDHIFTTQAHPEFTTDFMECVLNYTDDKVTEFDAGPARATLNAPTDGARFAAWTTEFFQRAAA